jgi:GntR family transcriptional regulator
LYLSGFNYVTIMRLNLKMGEQMADETRYALKTGTAFPDEATSDNYQDSAREGKRGRHTRPGRESAAAKAGVTSTRRDVLVDLGDASIPLYESIKLELVREISSGKIRAGMALPTERELSLHYNVSIGTVRRAMSDLVAEKVLVRQQGRGTFLAPVDTARMLNSFWPVTRKDGVKEVPIVQTLRFDEISASEDMATALAVRAGAPLFRIFNIMLMGGAPVLLDVLCIPQSLFQGMTKAGLTERNSTIYDLYHEEFGVTVIKTLDKVSAVAADSDAAKKLDVALGTPLLKIVRVAYTFGKRPVELRQSLLLTENYEFVDMKSGRSGG